MDDSKILLENGTNELMILEFKLGDNYYGINVAKIREITKYEPVTPIPNAHPSIEGVFMPRDVIYHGDRPEELPGPGRVRAQGTVHHHELQQTGHRVPCRQRPGYPYRVLDGHHQA